MLAVFKRELKSNLHNISAYLFCAFLMLMIGMYTTTYNLQHSQVDFENVLNSVSFIFMVIIPVLTMRSFAEEKKQRTDQLLYSIPMSLSKVVIGKYLALVVILLVPMLITCLYPLILSNYGNVNLPLSYSAIFGFFLMGAAFVAIGVFISSLTDNQAVAAGLCFIVLLINYFIYTLANYLPDTIKVSFAALMVSLFIISLFIAFFTKNGYLGIIVLVVSELALILIRIINPALLEGLFPAILRNSSLFTKLNIFLYGLFDVSSIVFYIVVICVFLYLTVQTLERRRWS